MDRELYEDLERDKQFDYAEQETKWFRDWYDAGAVLDDEEEEEDYD